MVQFYARQLKVLNHEVREAACEGFAELVAKIDAAAVRPLLPQILRCLLAATKDGSWPVRNALCDRKTSAITSRLDCHHDAAAVPFLCIANAAPAKQIVGIRPIISLGRCRLMCFSRHSQRARLHFILAGYAI